MQTLRLAYIAVAMTAFPLVAVAQAGLDQAAPGQQNEMPKKQKEGGFGAHRGWYIGIGGGYNSLADQGFRLVPRQPLGNASFRHVSVSQNAGWGAKLNAGYNFGPVWRFGAPKIELEYAYRQNNVDKFNAGGGGLAGSDGNLEAQTLLVNVLHNFMPESSFGPYIGIGGGYANIKYDKYRFTGRRVTHDSDWVFAYQAMVGVRYDLSPKAGVTLDYRYMRANQPSIEVTHGTLGTNYISNAVMLNFEFTP